MWVLFDVGTWRNLMNHNVRLARRIYKEAKIPEKTILCYLQMGWDDIEDYAKEVGYKVQYPDLLLTIFQLKHVQANSYALYLGLSVAFRCENICVAVGEMGQTHFFVFSFS